MDIRGSANASKIGRKERHAPSSPPPLLLQHLTRHSWTAAIHRGGGLVLPFCFHDPAGGRRVCLATRRSTLAATKTTSCGSVEQCSPSWKYLTTRPNPKPGAKVYSIGTKPIRHGPTSRWITHGCVSRCLHAPLFHGPAGWLRRSIPGRVFPFGPI
jgi:hypothetical protein